MKFVLLGEYCSLNEYVGADRQGYGWTIKKAETNRAKEDLEEQWNGTPAPLATYKFTWYRMNRRTDPDNICAFARKVILDGMQKAGILDNDGWKQVAGFIDEFYVDKENPRVVIELLEE